MKLVTYEIATPLGPAQRIGSILQGEADQNAQIVDLNLAYTTYLAESGDARAYEISAVAMAPDMLTYLEGGKAAFERAKQAFEMVKGKQSIKGPKGENLIVPRSGVKLLSPLPRPQLIRDFTTYEEHSGGDPNRAAWYYYPGAYKGNPSTVVGPDEDAMYPYYTDFLDPELEIGCYINKRGKNIDVKDAEDYIGGFTIYIDLSARDCGQRDTLGQFKGKDFCSVIGPCMVTPDEFDEHNAKAGMRVNGELWYESNAGHLRHHYFRELIAYASDSEWLVPGDLLGSGTIGLGASITLGKWLHPGDVLEQWVEGIGALKVNVVKEENPHGYARNGIPGQLKSVPAFAEDYPKKMWEELKGMEAARFVPRGARVKRDAAGNIVA